MTGPNRSGNDGSFAGLLVALAIFLAGGLWIADRAGVDVGGLLPDAPAATAPDRPDRPDRPVGGGAGKVVIPDAVNKPGVDLHPRTMRFLERVADIYGGTMIASSGTGGVHGENSDHYPGWAADFGMATNGERNRGPKGDRMMRACLIAAGYSEADATRIGRSGGLITVASHDGFRIQCIWKRADHDDHVHIAARPLG